MYGMEIYFGWLGCRLFILVSSTEYTVLSIYIIHFCSVSPVPEAPLACPLPPALLSRARLERVSLLLFSSLRQNAYLAHSPFLGVPVLAGIESPSRSLVDALGRALSSCTESPVW
jgi:hypothetical protein